jgi:hypothetical protein
MLKTNNTAIVKIRKPQDVSHCIFRALFTSEEQFKNEQKYKFSNKYRK